MCFGDSIKMEDFCVGPCLLSRMAILKSPDTILRQDTVDQEHLATAMLDSHYASLHFLAYSILGDADAADDAVQETIIRALDRIDSYQIGSNMKAWLSTIVVNQCRNVLRRRAKRQRLTGGLRLLFRGQSPQKTSEYRTMNDEAKADLWAAVDNLNEKHRLPIILRYVHNLSIREISQMLDIREGTIHSRLNRACQQLRRELMVSDSEELIKEYLYE